jgi:serine/threonine protein kinase/WD40 repeat protein
MTGPQLPLDVAFRIDQACRRFEAARRGGRTPRIEEFLAESPEVERAPLLEELLPLEVELRLAGGERPHPADYLDRFPGHAELIADAFHDLPPGPDPAWPAIPGYRVLGVLGRGGMGIVYRAEEVALGRQVALKVLSQRGPLGPQHRRRFEREAKAAARLHHTNIVPVFGVGEANGLPFYAMQLIPGQSLDAVITGLARARAEPAPGGPRQSTDDPAVELARSLLRGQFPDDQPSPLPDSNSPTHDLGPGKAQPEVADTTPDSSSTDLLKSVRAKGNRRDQPQTYWQCVARIGLQVASALDHAHRQGVLHRDIKPSNLLLDTHGTVWVTDFGLAKVADQDNLTATGDLLGTLRYLPPEALEGKVDARGDQYALGLTLYELLALRPAFDQRDHSQLIRQLTTADPPRLDSLNGDVPRDLVTIVHKAMEREPGHRYPSAAELAADLQRFLEDEPIRARRLRPFEALLRWGRRNRAVAALSAAVLLALMAGTVVSALFAIEAGRREALQKREAEYARQAEVDALRAKRQSDLRSARLKFEEAVAQAETGAVDLALFGLVEALRLAPEDAAAADFRRVVLLNFAAWRRQLPTLRYALRLWDDREEPQTWIQPVGPDGATFAAWRKGGPVQFRTTATGAAADPDLHLDPGEWPLAVSPDGTLLLARTSFQDPTGVRLRRLPSGRPVGATVATPPLHPRSALPFHQSFVFAPDQVMTGGFDSAPGSGPRRFWDLTRGTAYPLRLSDEGVPCYRLLRASDGRRVAVVSRHADEQGQGREWCVELWDVATGKPATRPLRLVADDPRVGWDGRTVMTLSGDASAAHAGSDGAVHWWELASGRLVDRWLPRRRAWFSALMPDGQTLIAYGQDDRVRVFDLDTGLQRGGHLHLPGLPRLDETPNKAYPGHPVLLTHLGDGVVRAWDTGHLERQATAAASPRQRLAAPGRPPPRFQSAAVSPSGRLALLCGGTQSDYGRLVAVATGHPIGPPLRQPYLHHVAFSPDERVMAVAPFNFWKFGTAPEVTLFDTATGLPRAPAVQLPTYIHALEFSPDGTTVAVGCIGRTALVDVATASVRLELPERSFASGLAFSPDGTVLAAGYRNGWLGVGAGLRLWDVATGKPLCAFQPLPDRLSNVPRLHYFDRGRSLLVFEPNGAQLYVHDAGTGRARDVALPPGLVQDLAVRDDGVAALSYAGGTVVQWDFAAGRAVGPPMAQPAPALALAYSGDGRLLAVVGKDHAVRLWDSALGLPLGPPLQHATAVLAARFSADGRALVTVSAGGTVRHWPLPEPAPDEPDLLELWLRAAGGRRPALGESVLLDPDAWRDCCAELERHWPAAAAELAARRAAPPAGAAWHDARAAEAEVTGNTYALLWHLERLARLSPDDWRVQARRGDALAAADEWNAAAVVYAVAAKRGGAALPDWYAHRAALARNQGRWGLALWYYDRCVPAQPGRWYLHADRATVHQQLGHRAAFEADLGKALDLSTKAPVPVRVGLRLERGHYLVRLGRWREAAVDFEAVTELPSPDRFPWQTLPPLYLLASNADAYRKTCARLVDRFRAASQSRAIADTAFACVLAPDSGTDPQEALRLADAALKAAAPDDRALWYQTIRALALHRAGRHADAAGILKELQPNHDGYPHDALAFLVRALVFRELGQKDQAAAALAQGRALQAVLAKRLPSGAFGDNWYDRLHVRIVLAEAERLMGGKR